MSRPHPHYIPLPAPQNPLRSALKNSASASASATASGSRSSTPAQSPGSPPSSASINSPFIPRTSTLNSAGSGSGSVTPFSPTSGGSTASSPASTSLPLPIPVSPYLTPTTTTMPLPTAGSTTASLSPLAAGYTPKVSFDTFEDPSASMFSYTLRVKTDGYERTRRTRVFLCAASNDESGAQALDWACESLVQDGDELIVLRGIGEEELQKDHDLVREDARELMRQIQDKCMEYDSERRLSLIVEHIAGRITTTIDRLVALYRPDSLVVGTRGQRGLAAWGGSLGLAGGVGSVSKYCLSHSPVPIIVVRPESKVKKSFEKRRADPKRGRHFDGLPTTAGVPLSPAVTRS